MVATTGVELVGDDTVVVKRASGDPTAIDALRAEGERLRQATHPGVVSLVRSGPTTDGWELVLAYGGRSLATLEHPSVLACATIVAGVASTMADLHEIGITHGRIDATHVLTSDGRCARLCGFGAGVPPAAPADDVAALGALLDQLLGAADEPEPIPERRWRRTHRWRGWERRALLGLADQATADDPERRPTARRLAAAIAATVPASGSVELARDLLAGAPERPRPPAHALPAPPSRRALPVVLVGLGLVLAAAAVPRLRASDAPSADVEVAAPVAGSLVVDEGRRFRVGEDGDHLLVADWSCDGHPTPAVFRPSTDEVFVFDRWTATEPLAVPPVVVVADAVEMVSAPGPDGCPELAVRTVQGEVVPVPLDDVR